ncbi:MAG: hypothetical protein ACUVUR_07600, partial [bacterium]
MLEKEAAKNRLGIQILFDFSDVIDAIDFAASNRFRVLEINLGNIKFREQLRRAVQRRRIRKWAQRSGVVLTVHALEGPSFFIPSDRVRNCAIKELKQTLDWA